MESFIHATLDWKQIPHYPLSTAQSHSFSSSHRPSPQEILLHSQKRSFKLLICTPLLGLRSNFLLRKLNFEVLQHDLARNSALEC